MSVVRCWCRVSAVSLFHFRTLSLSQRVKMAVPSHSLVRLASSARGAELCDATVAVTWPFRGSGSLAGPVCDLTFVTAADDGEYADGERSRKQQKMSSIQGRIGPAAPSSLRDDGADSLSVARSVGVRNWLGLYAKRQSVFFSLLSALWQSAA